ncbi:multidrug resistance protein, putative [Trichomonas vaginalis G3]|uniref:Multidrug resistance protein, putative n=1 Tax=Trichomonas vaginalis (strain ATCC PRA-98 / G3) TaxID=412133 RepID=A2GGN6_TRIV3|nr:small GTPase mediated signal transduction [Trichomonas vaginalis G3]EAX83680.1 multidrug resistance protein, putative [Trichomonas vaginalis G3]KAI5495440.1 small GTPase mediated signal transduction [Trichomonas vaginalis G3]|eukprot:XP_001296610.1 multidrug resistance protein [Trichomonas vaginalis G3]
MSNNIKLVVVGDGAVGKTCLLVVYARNEFPSEYVPTVFDNYTAKVKIDDTLYPVQLWDTAGQEELENIRTLSYQNTSVFLLCFSVTTPTTFDNLTTVWIPEIKRYVKNPEILLIGTKADLRNDEQTLKNLEADGKAPITLEQAQQKAKEIGAIAYCECSALKNEGVREAFDKAINHIIEKDNGGCCHLI